jgi:hypothetical protein
VVSTIKAALAPVRADLARLEGTLAALEARPLLPGPPGRDGRDGAAGTNGADGADGLGFDDLTASFDGDRTLALTFTRGELVKSIPIVLAGLPRHQGVYTAGVAYVVGDLVTWAGSMWICRQPTSAKPGESPAWQLIVKRGRDGKA